MVIRQRVRNLLSFPQAITCRAWERRQVKPRVQHSWSIILEWEISYSRAKSWWPRYV